MLDEGFVEDFSEQMETAIQAILCAIQNLAERNSKKTEESTGETWKRESIGEGSRRPPTIRKWKNSMRIIDKFCTFDPL